jgi:hypothetical protein
MPITFTENLKPDFPEGSFDTELQHVKLLFTEVDSGAAYLNPLQTGVTNLVTKIDSRSSELSSVKSSIQTDISLLQAFTNVNIDPNTGQPEVDPNTGQPITSLPECWTNAGHTSTDIDNIIAALNGIVSNIDTAINTILSDLKTEINTVDIDNFKLHMDLLSGVREAPPAGIEKPNNPTLMGLVRGITEIENRFGITFVNYLELVFESLFIGDVTIANTQTDLDVEPFVGTYSSLDVVNRVSTCPVGNFLPSGIISDINAFGAPLSQWNTDVAVNKPIFEQHIADDTAEYNSLVSKLDRYVQAYNISGYIQEPYYAFMYTNVFGSSTVNNIINQFQAGDIT